MLTTEVQKMLVEMVPPGDRSQIVNEALREKLIQLRRNGVTRRLRKLQQQSPTLSTRAIVSQLRSDRRR